MHTKHFFYTRQKERLLASAVVTQGLCLCILLCFLTGCRAAPRSFGFLPPLEAAEMWRLVHSGMYRPKACERDEIIQAWKERPVDFADELKSRMLGASPGSRERAIIGEAWEQSPDEYLGPDAARAAETMLADPDYRVRRHGFDLACRSYEQTRDTELRAAIWNYVLETYLEPHKHDTSDELEVSIGGRILFTLALELRREDIPNLIRLARGAGAGRAFPHRAVVHSLALLTGRFYAHEEGTIPESPNDLWQKVSDRYFLWPEGPNDFWQKVSDRYFLWYEEIGPIRDEEFFLGSLERLKDSIGRDSRTTRLAYAYMCHYLGIESAFFGVGIGPWRGADYCVAGWEEPLAAFEDQCKKWWNKAAAGLRWNPSNRVFDTLYKGGFRWIRQRTRFKEGSAESGKEPGSRLLDYLIDWAFRCLWLP